MPVDLWLDDERPAPEGWFWAKTVNEAKTVLAAGGVRNASLDHDLGTCFRCNQEGICLCHMIESCSCHQTGSDLLRWMSEHNLWPENKPTVHSANPVGRQYMVDMIERYWAPPGQDRRYV